MNVAEDAARPGRSKISVLTAPTGVQAEIEPLAVVEGNPLWNTRSLFGNSIVVPSRTARTRGTNAVLRDEDDTAGAAWLAEPGCSSHTTAPFRLCARPDRSAQTA